MQGAYQGRGQRGYQGRGLHGGDQGGQGRYQGGQGCYQGGRGCNQGGWGGYQGGRGCNQGGWGGDQGGRRGDQGVWGGYQGGRGCNQGGGGGDQGGRGGDQGGRRGDQGVWGGYQGGRGGDQGGWGGYQGGRRGDQGGWGGYQGGRGCNQGGGGGDQGGRRGDQGVWGGYQGGRGCNQGGWGGDQGGWGGYQGGHGGNRGGRDHYQGGRGSYQDTQAPQRRGGAGFQYAGGPSNPLVPELYQDTQAPRQHVATLQPMAPGTPVKVPHAESSSTQQVVDDLADQVQQVSVQQEEPIQSGTLASTKSRSFPPRPGKGHRGKRCLVKANHFIAELPHMVLHQYDVKMRPEVTSRRVNRAVMSQLVELYRDTHLGNRLPAYDGSKSLYTAGPLPFDSKTFIIKLSDEGDVSGSERRKRVFEVELKHVSQADLHHLKSFLAGGKGYDPRDALKILDIVLRELPTSRYTPVGRSFYDPSLGRSEPLGGGLESWGGFYQTLRPTQMGLSLNVDMSSTAFIEQLPVLEFVTQLLNRDVSEGPLSDSDRVTIRNALKGVRVEITHRGNMRKKYRISGLTSQATQELIFPVDARGTLKSMAEYYRETYGYSIRHVQLPCLQVGSTQRPFYLPMEVCKIVKGQRYSKKLNERQITGLLAVSLQRPQKREEYVLETVRHNTGEQDRHAVEFGIKINTQLKSVEARVLPSPELKYHDTGCERDCLPSAGQWNMKNKKMVNGGTVDNWICINFAQNVTNNVAEVFCIKLAKTCTNYGMVFNTAPVLPVLSGRPDQVERVLKAHFHDAMTQLRYNRKELDLLIVILPDDNSTLYGDVKRICETDLGVVSQCCKAKKVIRMSEQYLSSIPLKINVKVGGRNTVLADALSKRIPNIGNVPTIIFGADVSHPYRGEDSSPSIAAVVASQDWPEMTKYVGLVSAQAPRQELIQDLFKEWQDPIGNKVSGGMIKELLISFRSATGQKPRRIILYRDGVSDGQFDQVKLQEVDAIRKACASLEPDYQPPVTFVVVQKRHHTKLFPHNHRDYESVDRSGNIQPGTVVDTEICHPSQFDFYLCSHAGIKGTSRPAHYHVLWDENRFSADDLQSLTNNLCYTYARCTRSLSIVPPVYYAHLAAFRARFYLERDTTADGESTSGAAGRGGRRSTREPGANAAVRPLPALKDNVKRVMFYC